MTEQEMLQLIKKKFPAFTWKTYTFHDKGYDHVVIIFDNTTVFRIPRDEEYREKILNEKKLLDYLGKHITASIPQYTYLSRNERLAKYNMVSGKELTVSRYRRMSQQERALCIRQLGVFLTEIHATSERVVRQCHVESEDSKKIFVSLEKDLKKLVFSKLKSNEQNSINDYFVKSKQMLQQGYTPVLAHNDLSDEHILWDEKKKKLNVIDFSDRAWTDPAVDFAGLWRYGKKFVGQVYDAYKGRKDNTFLDRSFLYYQRVALYLMKDSQKGTMIPFEKGHALFQKRFKKELLSI